ncbi:MAG: N-acetyltransferase [Paenibacillaceae bacterium]
MEVQLEVQCRRAEIRDVESLYKLIQMYAEQGIMLPRSKEMLIELIDTFVVVIVEGQIVGCGSLSKLGEDLVEVRSLGISDGFKGLGIGRKLVDQLIEEARLQKVSKVMALTYEVAFFEKIGFSVVPKHIFPEKVWRDCVNCSKQYCCDEIAVMRRLE